mgnify:CR=1 FL=1
MGLLFSYISDLHQKVILSSELHFKIQILQMTSREFFQRIIF